MAYYLRVLTPSSGAVSTAVLKEPLRRERAHLRPHIDSPTWTALEVVGPSGDTLCSIERNVVEPRSPGEEEVTEFRDEIADCLPRSAAAWLAEYLLSVRTIYALQVHDATFARDGWGVVGSAHHAIWKAAGGIIQADGEGFSNEEGYHILWQFPDNATGPWNMAVVKDGRWLTFGMDLGNAAHRHAFKEGEIPEGVQPSR